MCKISKEFRQSVWLSLVAHHLWRYLLPVRSFYSVEQKRSCVVVSCKCCDYSPAVREAVCVYVCGIGGSLVLTERLGVVSMVIQAPLSSSLQINQ